MYTTFMDESMMQKAFFGHYETPKKFLLLIQKIQICNIYFRHQQLLNFCFATEK